MRGSNRILAVCNDYEACDAVLAKSAQLVKELEAGLSVMFVAEEALFELPLFRSDDLLDKEKLRHEILHKLEKLGVEGAAVFVYENDTADRVALEAERENDTLIVTHFVEDVSAEITRKTTVPVLVLKESSHTYAQAVVAVDTVPDEECLHFMKRIFSGVELTLYQDFQYVPVSATVDPALVPYDISMDVTLYTELMEAKRESFEAFCKEKGLKGYFEVGENGIDEDSVAFAQRQGADLLVIAAMDKDTMLGDAVEDILTKSTIDVLICFAR
ncbi:MAG: hypothetical protein DSZ05_06980 [Sulfurospirillum sp.]|nr:MAG: hypothetical protein DSZ05_06980 [Sulfurospirillum sp.]